MIKKLTTSISLFFRHNFFLLKFEGIIIQNNVERTLVKGPFMKNIKLIAIVTNYFYFIREKSVLVRKLNIKIEQITSKLYSFIKGGSTCK